MLENDPISESLSGEDFDRLKHLIDDFSHDIGAPLRAVVHFSQILIEETSDRLEEEERYWLQLILQSGEKTQSMMNALKRYVSIERSDDDAKVSLRLVLNDVLAQKEATIEALSGQVEVTGEWPEVAGSRDHWFVLFDSLIDNGLKFRDKNEDKPPLLKIHSLPTDCELQISVEDNGFGVSESHWSVISKPFKRLYPMKDFPGLGMGLCYCDRIAEVYGGELIFGNASLGGLSVTFIKPTEPK